MTRKWLVSVGPENQSLYEAIRTLDSCFSLRGQRVTSDPKSIVTRHCIEGSIFFVKKYTSSGKYLRKYLGRSRVRAEWENLALFRQWGIPTPEVLACGEERAALRFIRGALVTAGLPGALDMEALARLGSPLILQKDSFEKISLQVARFTRVMHRHHFAHNDLDWRNILVVPAFNENTSDSPQVYFFDCPAGRFWHWPFLEYRIVKDLAHLDKIAREVVPLRWRLRFYHHYTGRKRLTSDDKRRIRKVASYYLGRD